MRKLLGLLLAAIGLVFGHAAYQNAPTHREDQLADVTRILTNPGIEIAPQPAAVAKPAPDSTPTLSAPARVKLANSEPAVRDETTAPQATTVAEVAPSVAPPAAHSTAWQTSVSADAVRPGTTVPVSSAVPGDGNARTQLIRDLQTELKRLGCYSGEADGSWGNGSKRALVAFMERINASLPVEQPDYIQLTLLQGQSAQMCGRDCPKGQAQTDDGRCVPSAILARAGNKKDAGWNALTTVQVAGSGAKQLDEKRSDGQRRVATSATETLPWASEPAQAGDAARSSTSPRTAVKTAEIPEAGRRPPLAGRMSMGGPLPAEEQVARLESPGNSERANDEAENGESASLEPALPDGSKGQAPYGTQPPESGALNAGRPTPYFAAIPTAPQRVVIPRVVAQPRVRAAPRPQRAAARAQRRSGYRMHRSVQALFTHPLGHM
ncbi:MAG: peptidoglycan-binding domain-containing protein [Hyphomicrobium sp.]